MSGGLRVVRGLCWRGRRRTGSGLGSGLVEGVEDLEGVVVVLVGFYEV